ncbi:MAG TPA: cobalamin-dependent protein, partial [Candidatus Dorea intestinavium]|nr:cobalamin-dependent protein [Candidatus Dorea intestinavium]
MKTLLLAINSKYIHAALGIRSIHSYCSQKGLAIDFIEQTIQTPILTSLAQITEEEYDVLGIDVHIWNAEYVFSLIRLVKKVRPEVTIVVGGPEVSFCAKQVLEKYKEIDYVIQGEGEEVFAQLVIDLQNKLVPTNKSVAYRDHLEKINNDGNIAIVENLDVLPFSYDDIENLIDKSKIIYYESTRGCPFSCTYCLSGISHQVRKRSLQRVLEDLQRFIDAKVDLVKFVDRTYNLDENYFLPMMQFLATADTKTTFHFEIKADLLS